jgi:ABC-type transporter Mla MlaB component
LATQGLQAMADGAMRDLAIQGELNSEQVVRLRAELLVAVESCLQERSPLRLDVSAVGEWDGAGFQLLLAAARSLRDIGATLTLCGASAALAGALTRHGMHAYLAVESGGAHA